MDDINLLAECVIKLEKVEEEPVNNAEETFWNTNEELEPPDSVFLQSVQSVVDNKEEAKEEEIDVEDISDTSSKQRGGHCSSSGVLTQAWTISETPVPLESIVRNLDCVCNRRLTKGETLPTQRTFPAAEQSSCPVCQMPCAEKTTNMRTSAKNPNECSICGKIFTLRSNLVRHVRSHTGEAPHQCSICKKSFTVRGYLVRHMRTHTGERPFECSICNKGFAERGNLVVHMRIHTGEKPYKCSICGKNFSENGSLGIHMRTHTGDRPYECSVCKKNFTTKSVLDRHTRIHSGEKPYGCSVCNKWFSDKSHLDLHLGYHTGEKHECSDCKKNFTLRQYLVKHLRIHRRGT